GLPTHVVDIIHSGLSAAHQEKALEDFRSGKTSILIGSSKINAGINFPGVRRVIQYEVRDLTISDLDQCRGRGARAKDEMAVMIVFIEPSMLPDGKISGEDPGLFELIHSPECAEAIIQRHLENISYKAHSRHNSYPCCNRCDPKLTPSREYQWIEVNPAPSTNQTPQAKTTDIRRATILGRLIEWRLREWKDYWMDDWPGYGPKSLISDSDLEILANRPTKISSTENIQKYTRIVHWSQLTQPLFDVIQSIYQDL
ncbi:hypothetical protein B0H13DRAFT_1477350, partial [Mycena leptocephala]